MKSGPAVAPTPVFLKRAPPRFDSVPITTIGADSETVVPLWEGDIT